MPPAALKEKGAAGEQAARARLVPRSMCPKAGRLKDSHLGMTYAQTTRLMVPLLQSSKSWALWEMISPSWQCKQQGAQQESTLLLPRTHGQRGLRREIVKVSQEAMECLMTLQGPHHRLGVLRYLRKPKPPFH